MGSFQGFQNLQGIYHVTALSSKWVEALLNMTHATTKPNQQLGLVTENLHENDRNTYEKHDDGKSLWGMINSTAW